MFAMDASRDWFVVAHGHCHNFVVVMLCYMYQTWCGGSSLNYPWFVLCVWCQENIFLVWLFLNYINMCQYVANFVHVWWTALRLFLSESVEEGSFLCLLFIKQCNHSLSLFSLSGRGKDVQSIKYCVCLILYARNTQLR